MPVPTFTGLGPDPQYGDIVNKVNRLTAELTNLMLSLDSLNVVSLTADHIDTGTLDANIVTIRSDLTGGAYVQIDNNGIIGNDGTQNTFVLDTNGDVSLVGTITATAGLIGGWTIGTNKLSGSGILEGGTVQTAASGTRIALTNNSLKTYNSSGNLQGLGWGTDVSGNTYGDSFLYHNGTKLVEIYNNITNFAIRGTSSAFSLQLGGTACPTFAVGSWNFSNAVTVNSGTALNTLTQSDSTATTVTDIVSDFNTLLSNLRNTNILAT